MTRTTLESGYRTYTTPLGALPSVTTILSATDSEKSQQALGDWKRANPGNEAANRGTAVHKWVERTLKKEQPDYPDHNGESLRIWCEPLQISLMQFSRMIWIEGPVAGHNHTIGEDGHARVWSSQGFAGCPDLIGERFNDLCLADLKTSTSWYCRSMPRWDTRENDPDFWLKYKGYKYKFMRVSMQLVAYADAITETLGMTPTQLMVLVSNPGCKVPAGVTHEGHQAITLTQKEIEKARKEWQSRLAKFKQMQEKVA